MAVTFQYQLVRSRRKTIAIHVKPQGVVEVRAPLKVSGVEIERFVKSKEAWVNKHLQRFEAMPAFVEPQLCWGGSVLVLGESWTLVKQGFGGGTGREIELKLPWDASQGQFQKSLDHWFAKRSLQWFLTRHDFWRAKMAGHNLPPSRVSVRKMKRRWGSCRRSGAILFNSQLFKYSPECIDCVVVHELCHLVHFHHGPAFYQLMTSVMPEWRQADALLRDSALRY